MNNFKICIKNDFLNNKFYFFKREKSGVSRSKTRYTPLIKKKYIRNIDGPLLIRK